MHSTYTSQYIQVHAAPLPIGLQAEPSNCAAVTLAFYRQISPISILSHQRKGAKVVSLFF
jgi:hypothetical protein